MEVKNTIICPYCGTENEGRLCKECAAVLRTREEQAKIDAALAAGAKVCPSSPNAAQQTVSETESTLEKQPPAPEPALAGVSLKGPGTGSASMAPTAREASMGAPIKSTVREVQRPAEPVSKKAGRKEPASKEKRPNHLLYAVVTIIELLIILALLGLIVYLLRDVPVFREVYSFCTGIIDKFGSK